MNLMAEAEGPVVSDNILALLDNEYLNEEDSMALALSGAGKWSDRDRSPARFPPQLVGRA